MAEFAIAGAAGFYVVSSAYGYLFSGTPSEKPSNSNEILDADTLDAAESMEHIEPKKTEEPKNEIKLKEYVERKRKSHEDVVLDLMAELRPKLLEKFKEVESGKQD